MSHEFSVCQAMRRRSWATEIKITPSSIPLRNIALARKHRNKNGRLEDSVIVGMRGALGDQESLHESLAYLILSKKANEMVEYPFLSS